MSSVDPDDAKGQRHKYVADLTCFETTQGIIHVPPPFTYVLTNEELYI
jgi:hypothetical protein